MPALHRNPLSLACLGDEIPDQLGWSRLRAPHDEITWCPKIAGGIIVFKPCEFVEYLFRGVLPEHAHQVGGGGGWWNADDPLQIIGTDRNIFQPPAVSNANLRYPFSQPFKHLTGQVVMREARQEQAGIVKVV